MMQRSGPVGAYRGFFEGNQRGEDYVTRVDGEVGAKTINEVKMGRASSSIDTGLKR